MLSVEQIEKMAWEYGTNKSLTLTILTNDLDTITINNDEIVSESMEFTETLCDESSLTYGKVCANSFSVEIEFTTVSYKNCIVQPIISVDYNGATYSQPLGLFFVVNEERKNNDLTKKLTCYDAIYNMQTTDVTSWYEGLTYPITMADFRKSFFKHLNLDVVETTLVNDTYEIQEAASGTITALSMAQYICEANGVFGNINRNGWFEFVTLSSVTDGLYPSNALYPSDTLYPEGYEDLALTNDDIVMNSLTYQDYISKAMTSVGIASDSDNIYTYYRDIVGDNPYKITGNILFIDADTTTLQGLSEALIKLNYDVVYTPASVQTSFKPYVELGDNISITTSSNVIYMPLLNRTVTGIGAAIDKYEANGLEYYTQSKESTTTKIESLRRISNELTRTLEETKSEIKDIESGEYSIIQQTDNSILLKISQGDTESTIELGTIEEDSTTSGKYLLKLSSDVIKVLANTTLDLDAENITITSENFSVSDEGVRANITKAFNIEIPTSISDVFYKMSMTNNEIFLGMDTTDEGEYGLTISFASNGASISLNAENLSLSAGGASGVSISNLHNGEDVGRPIISKSGTDEPYGLSIQAVKNTEGMSYTPYLYVHCVKEDDYTVEPKYVVAVSESSDKYLKDNIQPTDENGLDKINALEFVQFDWNEHEHIKCGYHEDIGIVANDVEKIIPQAVINTTPDEEGGRKINNYPLLIYSMKAIQELSAKVDSLEKEIKELKGGR